MQSAAQDKRVIVTSETEEDKRARTRAALLYESYKTCSTENLPPKGAFTSTEWETAIQGYERCARGGALTNPQQIMLSPEYADFFAALRKHYVEEALAPAFGALCVGEADPVRVRAESELYMHIIDHRNPRPRPDRALLPPSQWDEILTAMERVFQYCFDDLFVELRAYYVGE